MGLDFNDVFFQMMDHLKKGWFTNEYIHQDSNSVWHVHMNKYEE